MGAGETRGEREKERAEMKHLPYMSTFYECLQDLLLSHSSLLEDVHSIAAPRHTEKIMSITERRERERRQKRREKRERAHLVQLLNHVG